MMIIVSEQFTAQALKQKQSLPLEAKIILSHKRIKDWYDYWDGQVYVSFSGGKDSTVLKHLVETTSGVYDVPNVFINTRLEYPEIQKFVRSFDNTTMLKPKISFKEVIEKHGYPIVTKEISSIIECARKALKSEKEIYKFAIDKLNGKAIDKNGNYSRYNCEKWKYLLESPFKISSKCCDFIKKSL